MKKLHDHLRTRRSAWVTLAPLGLASAAVAVTMIDVLIRTM